MAIFYKHIKGCGSNSVGSNSGNNTTDLWVWIEWANTTKNFISNSSEFLPKIYGAKLASAAPTSRTDFGHIITSNATNQVINQDFKIKQGKKLSVGDIEILDFLNGSTKYSRIHFSNNCYIQADSTGLQDDITILAKGGLTIANSTKTSFAGEASFKVGLKSSLGIYAGTENYDLEEGVIKAQKKCEALYFNATSDQRAKENIAPVSFSALSTVNSLPVYTFNYKTKPEEITIGLIAQEAAEYDLDNFNMVDNLTATGENNDFMQMKESKLVYVLWKAVQELSAEVESLKQQLASK